MQFDITSDHIIGSLLAPFRRFATISSAGGIALLVATAIALGWANSPLAASYHQLREAGPVVTIGRWTARATLHHLINDGLMTVFFLLVGLEIKREVLVGELNSFRTAALPMLGALGGMILPAAVYFLLNAGSPTARGWGIPMATDIAFALGVLVLLGDRVPVGLKVFLAALAIADDIGAVLVIAVFYAGGISWAALGAAAAILLAGALANRAGVRALWPYALLGVSLWAAMLASGVHASVAGVLLAMVIPLHDGTGDSVMLEPPLIRLEQSLHEVVAFGIMPLFAVANAGVVVDSATIREAAAQPVTLGVMLGLLLGKPLGILGFSWLAVRGGIAALPRGVTWPMVAGAGVLGGIGFTMALFIAGLAFPDPRTLDAAKLGILAASVLSGVAGWIIVRRATAALRAV